MAMHPDREELRELALEIATANGLMRCLMLQGKPYEAAEQDYQASIRKFDAALAMVEGGVLLLQQEVRSLRHLDTEPF